MQILFWSGVIFICGIIFFVVTEVEINSWNNYTNNQVQPQIFLPLLKGCDFDVFLTVSCHTRLCLPNLTRAVAHKKGPVAFCFPTIRGPNRWKIKVYWSREVNLFVLLCTTYSRYCTRFVPCMSVTGFEKKYKPAKNIFQTVQSFFLETSSPYGNKEPFIEKHLRHGQ